ncbi:hypothetical protein SETIT_8G054700v2 [Setaria italica]|uniref:Uncharacterized protein n=1 Tax=Setaria italica TaxID=4555 RepID=A0A368S4S4_SETIT|nr:hypothetical protein SETIT_8G054700v2 [Setaria italica]
MCAVSLLFAGLTAWVLCSSDAGDGEDKFSVVRRLSPLICAYLLLRTVALSESEARAALAARFMRASYLPLLAYLAAKVVGPLAGAASACAAAAACRAPRRAPAPRRGGAVGRRRRGEHRALPEPRRGGARGVRRGHGRLPHGLISAAVLCAIMWFESGESKLSTVVFFAGPYLLITRLRRRAAGMATFGLVLWWPILVILFVGLAIGEAAMMVVSWASTTAMAGYLGYGIAVHQSFEQLMIVKRQPPAVQDASGLPVGRDGEHAAAVHIDAACCVLVAIDA